MNHPAYLSLLLGLFYGGALGLLAASLGAHFGYRSADRLPGESRLPECIFCLRPLQLHEYFPLFGWLLRMNAPALPCPCGKRKGLWLQPVVEITGFVLGACAVLLAGWSPLCIPICLALGLLPAIAVVDLAFGIIPDGLNIILALLGLVSLLIGNGDIFMGLVNAAGLLGLGLLLAIGYSKLRGKEMLGIGDVKFFAAAGLWLPTMLIPWFLFISGIVGALMGLLWSHFIGRKEFPFAPALCLTLAGCVFYQLYLYAAP